MINTSTTLARASSPAGRVGVALWPGAAGGVLAFHARLAAWANAHSIKPSTSAAPGRPNSTASCSARLWVWSKKAVGRCAKALSDQAKLNSPNPTPVQGLAAIIATALRQMLARELGLSAIAVAAPSVATRAAAPSAWWLISPYQAIAPKAAPYSSGVAASSQRDAGDRRLSITPHSSSRPSPTAPVREALSSMASTIKAASTPSTARCSRPRSCSATPATRPHSSRLARWLGWRRLPTARPGTALGAIQLASAQPGANTCISATLLASTPASSRPKANASNPSGALVSGRAPRHAAWLGVESRCAALAPVTTISPAANNKPAACKASDRGSAPQAHDPSAAPTINAMAASSIPAPRGMPRGGSTITTPPHSATARHWFSSVADGGWL